MVRDPIFQSLPLEVLLQLAKILKFDPAVPGSTPRLLSSLGNSDQINWLDKHRGDLEDHFSFVGSSLLAYVTGRGKSYREILIDLAKTLEVSHMSLASAKELEQSIIRKVWNDTVGRLTPGQKAELLSRIEALADQHGVSFAKEMTGFATLTAAQMSGFGVYLLGSTMLGALNGALGLGLGFGAFAGFSSFISMVIGPVGWAFLGIFTVLKLGAPNYKKLLPAVLAIATARAAQETMTPVNGIFQTSPSDPKDVSRKECRGHGGSSQKFSRDEKCRFNLKNNSLAKLTQTFFPDEHYLDLRPEDKALVDQLHAEEQRITREAIAERERGERLRETNRKREHRLLHKGKLQGISEEFKKNFEQEFPILTKSAQDWDPRRHYLQLSPEEQRFLKDLESTEHGRLEKDSVASERLEELEYGYRRSIALKESGEHGDSEFQGAASRISALRDDLHSLFPTFYFNDQALKKLDGIDRAQRRVFYRQLRLMHDGKTHGKHEVPGTSPKLWELDAGNSGKIYYRRDSTSKLVVELVGYKHGQGADYEFLRRC
ncbi:MAG: hypothetical protein ACJ74Y_08730 [Bryobacteraceae bacterium]